MNAPRYLNLLKITLPLAGISSILHRISAVGIFVLSLPMTILLVFSLGSSDNFEQAVLFFENIIFKLLLLCLHQPQLFARLSMNYFWIVKIQLNLLHQNLLQFSLEDVVQIQNLQFLNFVIRMLCVIRMLYVIADWIWIVYFGDLIERRPWPCFGNLCSLNNCDA